MPPIAFDTTVGSLDDIIDRARRIPAIHDFPTVDELLERFGRLAKDHPRVMRRRRIGTSRLDEPIEEFVVGDGARHILVVGGVHPNEPIGFRTLEHLAAELLGSTELRARLDATWHLIPCIDPDGTRLNEGWFGSPWDRTHYARGFYRPAPDEQVEWSFPLDYKGAWFDRVLPETQALMRLIDQSRPALMVGLHNAELGGVYYYLTHDLPGAVAALHAVPKALGLPLDAGEPESPHLERIADAVFRAPLSREYYDYLESIGLDPVEHVGGGGSADYLAPIGTLGLVAELPYWTHPDSTDPSPSGQRYRDVLERKAAALLELGRQLQSTLDAALSDLPVETPFLRASRAFVPAMTAAGEAEAKRLLLDESDREASVAEVFSNADLVRCFRLRFGGILLRALDAEVGAGTAPARLRGLRDRFSAVYESWCAEADAVTGLGTLPLERLVGVQFASTLAVAALLPGAAITG